MRIFKGHPHTYVHRARKHMQARDNEKAAKVLRHAIAMHPGDQHGWNHMAHLIKQAKLGDITGLKHCFEKLNAIHAAPEAHVWKTIRDNVKLEDLEKFVQVGYQSHRHGQRYPFLKFIFRALEEINTSRKQVFLNLDWYEYERELKINAELPHYRLNIFAPGFEVISGLAEKDLLLIGNCRRVEFIHDCTLYLSSAHKVQLHQVNHCPGLFVRNGVKSYDFLTNIESIRIGGEIDLGNLAECQHSNFWIFGGYRDLGMQGNNTVHIRKPELKEGESPWWNLKAA